MWKRTFAAPNVGGTYRDSDQIYGRVSGVYETAWANAERCLGTVGKSEFDFDASSPYSVEAGIRRNADGTTESGSGTGFSYAEVTPWLKYETSQHLYQVKYTDITGGGSHNLDIVPTLATFINAESTTHEFYSFRAAIGSEDGEFTVDFIDRTAPGPAPIIATYTYSISIEADSFK